MDCLHIGAIENRNALDSDDTNILRCPLCRARLAPNDAGDYISTYQWTLDVDTIVLNEISERHRERIAQAFSVAVGKALVTGGTG